MLFGCVATGLALAGALLPGLPTTPFLLLALWAFARSSNRLHRALMQVPLLRHALSEAQRFERQRTVRPAVKRIALAMAWSSAAFTFYVTKGEGFWLLASVSAGAVAATLFVAVIPTARD